MVFVARDVKRLGRGWDVFAVVMDLVAHGVRIETIADGTFDAQDPNALAVWGIKIVVGSIERLTISKTTSQKMRRNQDAGRRMSHIIPFGMKTDPNSPLSTRPQTKKIDGTTSAPRPIGLIPDDGEQVVLAHMLELRAKGKGVRLIAKHLNAAGADDAAWLHRGRRWLPETVRRILKRAKRTE
jgi:DNA invertase Pin-like site-specific DNA recombinase